MTVVKSSPITITETHAFMRLAEKLWSEEERFELIDHLAHNPEAGTLIPGTGGVRKLRWGRPGVGKRGGTRVIYFYYRPDCPLYLLLAYAKAKSGDLSADQKKAMTALAATFKATADKLRGDE